MDVREEANKLERLFKVLSTKAPIAGFNLAKKRIDFLPEATEAQRESAQKTIDEYVDAGPSYRETRAKRYTKELSEGGENDSLIAIGDMIDDIVTAFVTEFPEYADPSTERGRSSLGGKIVKIQAIKREVPKQ